MHLDPGPVMDDEYWAAFPEVLSIADLARITRKTAPTVWRWLGDGKIPAHRISNAYVVYRETFRRKLEHPDEDAGLPDQFLASYPEEISVPQLAEILGKTTPTAYRWLAAGSLPGHRYAGSWLIYKHEVVQLLARTSNQPPIPLLGIYDAE